MIILIKAGKGFFNSYTLLHSLHYDFFLLHFSKTLKNYNNYFQRLVYRASFPVAAMVVQWVRAIAQSVEGWVFESQSQQT